MFTWLRNAIGNRLASYLSTPVKTYVAFSVTPVRILRTHLRPGDVLLVEGNQRISVAIKYLTQSTWSHAAIYVGDALKDRLGEDALDMLIEADLRKGVVAVPLATYRSKNTRICRAETLSADDRETVLQFLIDRLGMQYDLKHIFDLIRYLLPTPPVPVRWRLRMLSLGTGDPTRAICSTLIAQAFQRVKYPILPKILTGPGGPGNAAKQLYQMRHYGLFTPRDFDLSPYFRIIKPTTEAGFDYKELEWYEASGDPNLASRAGG